MSYMFTEDGMVVEKRLQEINIAKESSSVPIKKLYQQYISENDITDRQKIKEGIESYMYNQMKFRVDYEEIFHMEATCNILQCNLSTLNSLSTNNFLEGFEAIHSYALNLLSQPWRKEFKTIKKYSGFFKHKIEQNLKGAEFYFLAMGYEDYGDTFFHKDHPIEQILQVLEDSQRACIELRILDEIFQKILLDDQFATYLNIFEYRKARCDNEYIVKHLCGVVTD